MLLTKKHLYLRTQAMQNIITLEVLSATSEKSFSLDELVFRTKKLFETEGLAGFVGLILGLTDERICTNMVQGEIKHSERACCLNPKYDYHGQANRRLERRRCRQDGQDNYQAFYFCRPVGEILER